MKARNNWGVRSKQWDKFQVRLRLGKIDVFTIEVDISREFYMLTILNFSLKNR
jgi:hypothetical protein